MVTANPIKKRYICPICGGPVFNGICSSCKKDYIEINLSRRSALLGYYGNGMSTHAGLFAGLIFGLFQITQILFSKDLEVGDFALLFFLLSAFQLFGFYIIHRFTGYRTGGMKNETMINNFLYLIMPSFDYAESYYKDRYPKTPLQILLSSDMIKLCYSIFVIILDLLIFPANSYSLIIIAFIFISKGILIIIIDVLIYRWTTRD